MLMKNYFKYFITACLVFCVTLFYGAEIHPQSGKIQSSSTLTVTVGTPSAEMETFETTPLASGVADYNVQNLVILNLDHTSKVFLASPTSVRTKVSILRWDVNGNPMPTQIANLTVTSDNRYNKQTIDKSIFKDVNGYRIKMVIDSVFVNGIYSSTLPEYVYLESNIYITRYYQYTGNPTTILGITPLNTDCDIYNTIDELKVNWSSMPGAEEYQLEWTYVNDYGASSGSAIPMNNLYANFKNNATRISTKGSITEYKISSTYEKGYIAFRVRPVGRDYLNPDKYIYGDWSSADYVNLASMPTNDLYYNSIEHEKLKNWQYSATFAEEGKKKEVISYFDGSLHNRQSVTKVNSDQNVIVGETIYDFQGRPAINVLPTPVVFPNCTTSYVEPSLKFYPNYNKNTYNKAYTKLDFDLNTTDSCSSATAPMDTISGSSLYYSGNNPNKTKQQAFVPNAEMYPFSQIEYTPDNTGRIRSQSGVGKDFQLGSKHETKYIYSQPNQIQLDRLFGSEVGDAAHYKKNTVTDANGQISITYLNQEGKTIATSLAGNPPTDVNGNVILQAIPSESTAAVPFTVDAFNKDANGNSLSNKVTPLQDGIEFSTQLSVSYNSNYNFKYELNVDTLGDACLRKTPIAYCISCIYDLEIKVTDECGQIVTPIASTTNPVNKRIGHLNPTPNGFTMNCTTPSATHEVDQLNFNFMPGVYTVSKILTINKDARDFYVKSYLDSTYNSCFKTKSQFIQQALANLDTSSCYTSCNDCVAALGTKDAYVSSGQGDEMQYDFLVEQCMDPCRDRTLCESTYEMMLVDVSPGGMYGKLDNAPGAVTANGQTISVFNTANQLTANRTTNQGNWKFPRLVLNGNIYNMYIDENGQRAKVNVFQSTTTSSGWSPDVDNTSLIYTNTATGETYTYPENLKYLNDLIPVWNDQFARSLVMYHPEYAYYIACKDHSKKVMPENFSTDQFDSLLLVSKTFTTAKTNHLITSTNTLFNWSSSSGVAHAVDPFLTNSTAYQSFYGPFNSSYTTNPLYPYIHSNLVTQLQNKINNYQTINGVNYTMAQVAAMISRCGNSFYSVPSTQCTNFGSDFYNNPTNNPVIQLKNDSIRNKEWETYKNFYIAEKRKIQFQRMNFFAKYIANSSNASMPNSNLLGGCNACIGNTSFNMFTSGMYDYTWPSSSFWNAPAFDFSQPCSYYNYYNFTDDQTRQKRFVDPANTGLSASNVAYQMYQQTGQCPMTFQLQGLLNALAQGHYLYPSAQVQLGTISAFNPDLYNAVNGGVSPSVYINYKWQVVSTTGNVLTANIIDPNTNQVKCSVKIDINGTSIPNFQSLQSFQSLNYTQTSAGQDQFTLVASYLTAANTIATATIKGSSCITIHGCQFEPQCTPNQFAVDFMNLSNNMMAHNLATHSNYNMSVDTNINFAISATLKNAIGTPNNNMIWNYITPNTVEIFDNANAAVKLKFTITNITPSSASSNIVAYGNIRSNYNNLFKMDGLDVNGNKIALIEGKAEKTDHGTIKGLSMGECGLPEDPNCALTEHKVRKDLEKLLKECLTVKPFNGNINLYSQVNFTPLLQSFFTNTLTATTSVYSYTNGNFCYDSLKFNTNNSCEFELYQNSNRPGAQYFNFSDLIDVTSLTGLPPLDANQNFHNFYFIGTYQSDGSTVKDTVWGKSCFPLKNCTVCDPVYSTADSIKVLDSLNIAHGLAEYNPTVDVYLTYKAALDTLNTKNGWDTTSANYVQPMDYLAFAEKGYVNADQYVKFVQNFDIAVDSTSYLAIDNFIYKYGNFTNCTKEYDRYARAINAYNGRALTANANLLYPIADSSFYKFKLCDISYEYVKYLGDAPITGEVTKTIYEYFNINTNPVPPTDSCKLLYERYLRAYKQFINNSTAQQACKEAKIIHPLYSYDVIEKNNLCCTYQGLTLFNNYINALLNASTSCPPLLQSQKDCSSNAQTDINPKFCQRNYIYYLKKIEQYNQSAYALAHGHTLDLKLYPTFRDFLAAGYCECIVDYINYLNAYISAPANSSLNLPVDIAHFSGCNHTIYPPTAQDSCKLKYQEYTDAINAYNDYLIKNKIEAFPLTVEFTEEEFISKYCYCADKFIAGLHAIMNGYMPSNQEIKQYLYLPEACTPPPCTQTPPQTAFEFPSVPSSQNPCVAQLIAIATQNALNAYNQYVDSLTTSIVTKYNAHCLKAVENFEYTYTDKEYHFTLYYYDQAGNLVKTIPPEGVEFLNINSPTSVDEVKIKYGRLNNIQTVYTSHRMATTYEYNSLNQLVRQDMPDHDKMTICESTLPNGLDANLVINSSQFVTPNKGYLTGYLTRVINGVTVSRGYLYTTNDGGQNWTKVRGLAAGDMQKVQMVSSTIGYAVSNYGLIFKTLDGGTTWDLSTALYDASPKYFDQLNDLYFINASTGIVGGISNGGANGGVYKTTNGGASYSAASGFDTNDTITGLTHDGTNYYATVTNLGIGKIYKSNDGLSWTKETNFAANDLKRVQFISSTMSYAVANDGTLLKSTTPNNKWTLVATNEPYNFVDIYFKDANNGIALIDSIPGKAKVYKTFNGGNTWAQLSAPGKFYTTLQSYDIGKVIASGENGLIAKIVMTTPPFGMININGSIGSTTDDFSSADAIYVNSKLPSLVVGNTGTVYFTYDAMPSSPSWLATNTSVSAGFKKGLISVSTGTAPIVKGIMLGNNGVVYHFYKAFNAPPVFTTITGASTNFIDITSSNASNTPNFYGYDNTSKRIYSINYSGTVAAITAMTNPGVTPQINSIDMSNNGGEIVMVGNSGVLLHGAGVTANNSTINWTNVTNSIVPLPLNDIAVSSGNLTAIGNDGTQWIKASSGTVWQLANTGTSAKLNAVKIDNSAIGLVAANSGKLYSVSNAVSANPTYALITTSLTNNLTDVAIATTGNGAYVTSQAGNALYITNYTSPSVINTLASNINGALNGASFYPGSSVAVTVGNKTGVILFNNGSGVTISDIYTKPFNNVHFYDNNNGYVVDSGYVMRHTNNAGNTWDVVVPKNTIPLVMRVYATGPNNAVIVGGKRYIAQINNNAVPFDLSVPGGVPATIQFNDVNFNQTGYGVIVGTSAYAVSITSSGTSFVIGNIGQPTPPPFKYSFNAVHVFNDNSFITVGTKGNIFYYKAGTGYVKQNATASATDVFNDVFFHDDRVGYVVGNSGKAMKCVLTSNIGAPGSVGLSTNQIPWFSLCSDVYLSQTPTNVHFNTISFSTRTQGFLAGSFKLPPTYTRHALLLNDESGLYSTRFWYDKLGRMVVSQNTKQFNKNSFSYTLYDALGRITEVGEKYENTTSAARMRSIFGTNVNGIFNLKAIDDTKLSAWINDNSGLRKEVTKTYYDQNVISSLPITQENLRKRVSSVTYEDLFDGNDQTYQHATHYTYDIHGNVTTLIQDNKKLYDEAYAISPTSQLLGQRFKRIDYGFDLISGKVNVVRYQDGQPDAFYHFYQYDDDNKITEVYTSSFNHQNENITIKTVEGNPLWTRDAKYYYYAHGPLARVEYGDVNNQVQGIDYAYTIQGWIKGVNSNTLDKTRDMGQDGLAMENYDPAKPDLHANIAQDAFGYTLNYYKGDYRAINHLKWSTVTNRFEAATVGSQLMQQTNDLFNGNIKSMITTIAKIDTTATGIANPQIPKPLGNAYKYDQLNRIKRSVSYTNIDMPGNLWQSSGQTIANMYANTFTYDANGNILTQNRSDENGQEFEALKYNYRTLAGKLKQNRLYHVNDNTSYTSLKTDDIDNQGHFANGASTNPLIDSVGQFNNYSFDEIGNLIKDKSEQISSVLWNFYGKVKSITRVSGSSKDNLVFDYDSEGNRIAKHVYDNGNNWRYSIYYILNSEGEILSVYRNNNLNPSNMSFIVQEQHIYGNSRIGMSTSRKELILNVPSNELYYNILGKKYYELTNHLSSVSTVISDRRIPYSLNGITTIYSQPDIISTSDFSAFGNNLHSRNSNDSKYNFGFGGQMKDDEVSGDGNSYTAEFWQYDPRLGRRWNMDPKPQINISDYACFGNNPILYTDIDGDEFDKDSQKKVDKVKSKIEERKKEVDTELGNVNKKIEDLSNKKLNPKQERELKNLNKQKEDLGFQKTELEKAGNEIKEMEKSTQMFHLKSVYNPFMLKGGKTVYNKDGSITMKIGALGDYSTTGHELKHGYQYITGDINFNAKGNEYGSLGDRFDEVNAYKRQYALNPDRVKNGMRRIKYAADIKPGNVGSLLKTYKLLKVKDLNINNTTLGKGDHTFNH